MKYDYKLSSTCRNRRGRLGLLPILPLLIVGLALVGCDSAPLDAAPHGTELRETTSLAAIDFVDQVAMTVEKVGPSKEEVNTLHITLKPDSGIRYPEAFRILGMSEKGEAVIMRDDGAGDDLIAGDLTYSARVDRSCLETDLSTELAGKDILSFTLSCDFDFIAPGEECEGYGVCEETASRSFLWGLIEYDVDVVTCWCFLGCEAEFEFKL